MLDAENRFLTAKDLAERWQVHVETVRRRARNGVIPTPLRFSERAGHRWARNAIEEFEDAKAQGTPAPHASAAA